MKKNSNKKRFQLKEGQDLGVYLEENGKPVRNMITITGNLWNSDYNLRNLDMMINDHLLRTETDTPTSVDEFAEQIKKMGYSEVENYSPTNDVFVHKFVKNEDKYFSMISYLNDGNKKFKITFQKQGPGIWVERKFMSTDINKIAAEISKWINDSK